MPLHTPAPWQALHDPKCVKALANMRREDGRKHFHICRFPTRDAKYPIGFEEYEANRRLIEAAPELYDALRELLNSDLAMRAEDEGESDPLLDKVRGLLARIDKPIIPSNPD